MARYDTQWQHRSKKSHEARVRWMRLLVTPGVLLVAILVAWVVVKSPLLKVRAIEVVGASRVDKAQVIDAARAAESSFTERMLTRANLLGWPSSLPPAAVSLVPGARTVSVSRGFFSGTVILTITERDPVGVWCFEASGTPVCQWFDEGGVVYGRAYISEGSLVPVVHDLSQERAGEGRRVLSGEQLNNFLAIVSVLKTRGISPKVVQIANGNKQEVTMSTYNGPRLLFTLRAPPDQAPPVLDDFIKKGTLNGLSYIDFRSTKRAFYQ